ncbi:MAG: hypothetical protein IPL35_02950 [Sphingobacteriales bacterium]|nr:hypothetical protein [Sphingobacteriales bacterium]
MSPKDYFEIDIIVKQAVTLFIASIISLVAIFTNPNEYRHKKVVKYKLYTHMMKQKSTETVWWEQGGRK